MRTQFVLVPGFWLGGWAWDEVAPLLRERGVAVDALTLPGGDGEIRLEDWAKAIREALDGEATRRVLVAHSGAAFAAARVIDQHPDLVDHLVLVDTALPGEGTAFDPEAEGDFAIEYAWDSLEEEGSFRDLTEDQLATMRSRARPVPQGVVTQPVSYTSEARFDVPVTCICTAFPSSEYEKAAEAGIPYFADMPGYRTLRYVDLPTGHWPMWSKPAELADLLLAAAEPVADS